MRVFTRARWSAFLAYHVLREGSLPFASPERLERLRRARTQRIVRYAYESIPYYRRAIESGGLTLNDLDAPDLLERLPLLDKDQILDDQDLCSPAPDRRSPGLLLRSNGTNGRPRVIFHDAASIFMNLAGGRRLREAMASVTGRTRGCREILFARPGSAYSQIRDFYRRYGPPIEGGTQESPLCSPDGRFGEHVAFLNDYRPDVIRGYGSYLAAFFTWLHGSGKPFHKPKALIYGADAMPDPSRRMIEEDMGIPIFGTYQAAEVLRIGYQCPRREGFHLYMDQVHVRVADSLSRTLQPPATGEIVVSSFVNRGTVLLNYRLGDVVSLISDPCPCGRTGPRILRIEGRDDDLIRLPGGTSAMGYFILRAAQEVKGVLQVQVEQLSLDRVVIRVVAPQRHDKAELAGSIASRARASFPSLLNIAVEKVDRIPPLSNGKVKAIISRL